MQRMFVVVLVALPLFSVTQVRSEDVYFEQDGVTHRQKKYVERRPVTTTTWEESQRTVYREQYVTELRDSYRTVVTPVTEYQMEPRWHNWWNPFGRPYIAYHMRPRTRWESHYQRYQTPITVREVVPEVRTVMTPVRRPHFVEEEVTETVAIPNRVERSQLARTPAGSSVRTARRPVAVGGIERLDDPLRR